MNERIKELAEQCVTRKFYVDHASEDFDYKKFAELIVRECADYVQFYYKDHMCEVIAHDMKTYFGVE
jgi:hypothetical protein